MAKKHQNQNPKTQHYVPCMYLKYWGHGDKKDPCSPYTFVFRKLVYSEDVPILEELSTKKLLIGNMVIPRYRMAK